MKTIQRSLFGLIVLAFFMAVPMVLAPSAGAEETGSASIEDDADLAQELTNPLADLMTIPIQICIA